ncbi:MAG: RT0821/Lpp0805 family surface protein [Arenicellales bacterium]|nr:RT0821/Lpp0805 family surface protein [Arenicellales bacterium]
MIKTYSLVLAFVSTLVISIPAFGINLLFLDDAPIARFKEKDVELMLNTLTDALENADNGVEMKWENPDTGYHGSIIPLNKITQDGKDCRRVNIRNVAGDFRGSGEYLLCKYEDGEWRVPP